MRHSFKTAAAALLGVVTMSPTAALAADPPADGGSKALVIAHRGLYFGNPHQENTRNAWRQTFPYANLVEADVFFTRTHIPVLLHHWNIRPLTTGSGDVRTMSLRQLRQYKTEDGQTIPSLRMLANDLNRYNRYGLIHMKESPSESEWRGMVKAAGSARSRMIVFHRWGTSDNNVVRQAARYGFGAVYYADAGERPSVRTVKSHGAQYIMGDGVYSSSDAQIRRWKNAGLRVLYSGNATFAWDRFRRLDLWAIFTDDAKGYRRYEATR